VSVRRAVRRRRRDWPRVAIVGGGFGGVAAGVKLRAAGFENFTIFEKSRGPGGTWWDNRYPGAEVDVSSHLYSFSFMHYDWTCTHAQQAELQQYVEDVIDRFGLRPRFRFSTPIEHIAWDDAKQAYDVTTGDGDTGTFEVVISAVGLLNQPRYPDWPGLDSFEGPAFHTARWEPQHDLSDKTVALVGTGSTAAQIVPAIADVAGRVVIFQREPGWVVPKPTRIFTHDERAALSKPWNRRRERLRLLFQIEKGQFFGSIHRPGTKTNSVRGGQARAYIDRTFKDRPDLRAAVTPSYPYPGKRPVIAQGYYEALLRDDVQLVPFPVVSVTPTGIVDARGIEHAADLLVLSTGFQPSSFLNTFDIVGRAGRTLREFWHGEPQAFLGITVPEFPNFYMLYGPNTNGGEIITHLERQAEYAVRSIKRLGRGGITAIEVRRLFYERYNWWLQRQMGRTAWVMSNNYYKSPSGRIVTQWPYGVTLYGALTKLLGRVSEKCRRVPATVGAQPASAAGPIRRLLTPVRWEGARRSRSRAAS
jgi:cation diffusion facilitator CzcD-associated flavoprotein CzcO